MTTSRLTVAATRLVAVTLALSAAACANVRPSELPEEPGPVVAVKTRRLPSEWGWFVGLAHHSYVDLRTEGEDTWRRASVEGRDTGAAVFPITGEQAREDHDQWREVEILCLLTGDEARRAIAAIEDLVPRYADSAHYRPWPGPNSNTFIDRLGRQVPELRFVQDHNAFEKDYVMPLRIGATTSGSGLEIETPIFGVQVGVTEGVEIHPLTATFAVTLFPPSIKIPFLPRIGPGRTMGSWQE